MVRSHPCLENCYPAHSFTGIDDFVYLDHNSQDLGVALSDGSGVNGFGGTGGYLSYAIPMSCTSGIPWFKDIDGEYAQPWSEMNNYLFTNDI
jgi:hypothetical protein